MPHALPDPSGAAWPSTRCLHDARRFLSALLVAGSLLSLPWIAHAQAHSSETDGYILRSSTAPSEYLSAETARANGIQPGPRRAVVDVSVYRKRANAQATLPARIEVTARDLSGVTTKLAMREVRANGGVSYVGTYDFVNSEVVDFTVTAIPDGSNVKLKQGYRERMWSGAR